MQDYNEQIKKADEALKTLKQAFQPMPGGAPMDPAMMQQGAPPMDPAMMQQGGAPMDPAMMQQGGAPMDPAMMQQGGAPPPADPAQMEAMISEVMHSVEQVAGAVEQSNQQVAQLQSQLQQMMQEHAMTAAKIDMLEKAINSTSPMEGMA
jgi:hypothetical protein